MVSKQESKGRLMASTLFGAVVGAVIGLALAHYQGIPVKRPVFWWSQAIAVMMFTVGVTAQASTYRPEWRIWQALLVVVALGFVGLEFYMEPNLISLFKKADPVIYNHILLGQGLGALCGFVMAKLFTRK